MGVIASTVMAIVAIVVSVFGQRRADALAERSAAATERMAKALEGRALEDEHRSPTPDAAWKLQHFQGDTYLLTNAGRATAYDVHVDTGDLVVRGEHDHERIEPDGFAKFLAVRTWGTRDDTITVTWSTTPGGSDRHTWQRPLPPRPPRR